jgi:hypothetical protein
MITSEYSSRRDCHKAASSLLPGALFVSTHPRGGKDSIASWNPSNSWRDTDLRQSATTPLLADCPRRDKNDRSPV